MIDAILKLLIRLIDVIEEHQARRIMELETEIKDLKDLIAYREAVATAQAKADEAARIRGAAEREKHGGTIQ